MLASDDRPAKYLRSYILVILGIFLMAAAAFAIYMLQVPYQYHGSSIDPPLPAPDFQLTDQNGQPFQLSSAQGGKVTLLFFGFTNCTDICPLTLAQFKQIKDQLGSRTKDVRFIFITVDPERDTAQVLNQYLGKFDQTFTGLTGSAQQLGEVWKAYGVYIAQQGTGAFEKWEHSSQIYVIDTKSNLRMTYDSSSSVNEIKQDVVHLLGEK